MKKTVSRILWGLEGVLLIIVGIVCLWQPDAALAGLSLLLGLTLLAAGIVEIVVYAQAKGVMTGAGWYLVDGILTILLSLFLLWNQAFTTLTLPFIFGMWLMFSGVTTIVSSLDQKAIGTPSWGWFLVLGIILTVFGFIAFCDPFSSAVALGIIVGVFLIMEGVVCIVRAFFAHHFFQ